MGAYLLRRLVGAAFLLVLMSLAIYALIGLMPGDPLDLMLRPTRTSPRPTSPA